jgi:hypothetical protein
MYPLPIALDFNMHKTPHTNALALVSNLLAEGFGGLS